MAILSPQIGIDLGTSNTLIYVKDKGLIVDEPSISVVTRGEKRTVKAIGSEARTMLGRTSGDVTAVRPLADGMIRDFDVTQTMLNYFVRKAIGSSRLFSPKAVITVPCRISPVEKRAIVSAASQCGIRSSRLHLIAKPFAAAIGSGLPVFEPRGSMIVDIGGGTTEIAVISMGGLVISRSIRVGGDRMDESIIAYVKREFNMLIGDRTAESVKIDLGSAVPLREERKVTIRGRDLITSLPQTATLTSSQVYEALSGPCQAILSAIRKVLECTPPELAGDIIRGCIHLTGGGSMLFGMDSFISSQLDMAAAVTKDPMQCAATGIGKLTDHIELLSRIGQDALMEENTEETEQ